MRIPRIYSPLVNHDALTSGEEISLEAAASHHLIKVLRMEVGRELIVFNGNGGEFSATITAVSKKSASIILHRFTADDLQSPLHTHLGIALSRGERFDFVLQKATELGVTEITPLLSERTEVKLSGDRLEKRCESWQKIVISACEQCGRNLLPKLHPLTHLHDFVQQSTAQRKFVLHHRNTVSLNTINQAESVALVIGPEGGLSEDEITHAHKNDFGNLALGPRVLRTETAPLAALAVLQYAWGDL